MAKYHDERLNNGRIERRYTMVGNLLKCSVLVFLLLTGLPVFAAKSELFWGSRSPIWNNDGDTIFMRDTEGELVLSLIY